MSLFKNNERFIIESVMAKATTEEPSTDDETLVWQFLKLYNRSRRGIYSRLYAARRSGTYKVYPSRASMERAEQPIFEYTQPGNFFFTEKAAIILAANYIEKLARKR